MADRILFLDIDGVLNSHNWFHIRKYIFPDACQSHIAEDDIDQRYLYRHCYDIDPTALGILRCAVEQLDLKIVLSSSWRILTSPEDLQTIFEYHGWSDAPVIGYTPRGGSIRGIEIDAWMAHYSGDIENFAIIDDDSDFTPDQKENHFVHTQHRLGMNYDSYCQLVDLFNEGPNPQMSLFSDPDYSTEGLYTGRYKLYHV